MGLRTTFTRSYLEVQKSQLTIKGKLGFKNDIKKDFEQAEKSAEIQLINTSFQYKPLALFQSLDGSMRLLNNRLEIDSVKGFNWKGK